MIVIDVMAIVMDIVIGLKLEACDTPDGDVNGHCYKIEAVLHVIDVLVILMDIVIGLKV